LDDLSADLCLTLCRGKMAEGFELLTNFVWLKLCRF
jgi:hypothetical protein